MSDWFENDALFFSEVSKGHEYALRVGFRLLAEGFTVQVTKPTLRETIADRHAYSDEIDMVAATYPLEVKSRDLAFTCPHDYPFSTAFVDTESGWNKKDPVPIAVVLVSQQTKAMLVVPAKTKPYWGLNTKRDRQRDITDTWLEVERRFLQPFETLIDWLKRHADKP